MRHVPFYIVGYKFQVVVLREVTVGQVTVMQRRERKKRMRTMDQKPEEPEINLTKMLMRKYT